MFIIRPRLCLSPKRIWAFSINNFPAFNVEAINFTVYWFEVFRQWEELDLSKSRSEAIVVSGSAHNLFPFFGDNEKSDQKMARL